MNNQQLDFLSPADEEALHKERFTTLLEPQTEQQSYL